MKYSNVETCCIGQKEEQLCKCTHQQQQQKGAALSFRGYSTFVRVGKKSCELQITSHIHQARDSLCERVGCSQKEQKGKNTISTKEKSLM
jgi:hypothetical protein